MSPASGQSACKRKRSVIGRLVAAILFALIALRPLSGGAHETDQYTLPLGREFAELQVFFSRIVYDAVVEAVDSTNTAIGKSLANERPSAETLRLQSQDFIAGEVWANLFAAMTTIEGLDARLSGDALRARYPGLVVAYKPEQHIYDDPLLLIDVTKVVRTLFRGATVNVNGTLLGTDKILHLIHMGRIYHSSYLDARKDGMTEEAAIARAVDLSATGGNPFLSENAFLGKISTGVRSNADLASDYAGFKFYRNLTEPVRIGPRLLPPILVREGLYWRLDDRVRPGSGFFAAFITPHFNEALNPNTYVALTHTRVRVMLQVRCGDLLDWYRDERGRRRTRQQFVEIERELSTFYGEPYGHESDGKEAVSIANTCFEPDVSAEPALIGSRDRDRFGRTELWWEAREGQVDAVKILVAQGESPNAIDVDGETPLHAAARGGHATIIALLIAHGADPRATDHYGTTPLHVAIAASQPDAARVLLNNRSNVNARDMFGMMPLHQAVMTGDRELAALLLDHGANRTARYRMRTPAQLAAQAGDESLADWLVSYRTRPIAKSGGRAMQGTSEQPRVDVPTVRGRVDAKRRYLGFASGR